MYSMNTEKNRRIATVCRGNEKTYRRTQHVKSTRGQIKLGWQIKMQRDRLHFCYLCLKQENIRYGRGQG